MVASISLSLYCFGAVVAVRVVPRSRDLCLDGKSLTPFYAFLLSAVNVFLGGLPGGGKVSQGFRVRMSQPGYDMVGGGGRKNGSLLC